MTNSDKLFSESLKIAPGGVHSPVRAFRSVGGHPVFFKQSQGAHLTDVDDKSYIDFCQAFGPLLLGHRDPDVSAEVHKMIDTAWSLGACEPYSLELAQWLIQRISGLEKLRFVSSGTEAVMSAVRVARAATQRKKILKFEGCYHGHVDSMLVKAGSGLAGAVASDSAGVTDSVVQETLVAPLDDEAAVEKIFDIHGGDIAAVILEPLPANYGLLIQRKEFIEKVVEIARAHQSLVIFDEVISGFRVAMGGMAEVLGIRPDLMTYGKIVGGGFPVGCFGGRKELMDLVAPAGPVYQAGTLSANPVGMAAGLATLKKIESVQAHEVLNKRSEKFQNELQTRIQKHGAPLQVSGFASIFWIHHESPKPIRSLKDIPSAHREKFPALFHAALKHGVYFPPSGFEVCFLSLAHDEQVLNRALDAIEKSVQEVYGSKK